VKGETVPFTGQLLSTPRAIALGQAAYRCELTTQAAVEHERELAAVDFREIKELRELEYESCQARIGFLKRRVKELEHRPWYREPGVVATATALVTGVAIWGMTR